MELWEKQRAYIPRRFVCSDLLTMSIMITFFGRTLAEVLPDGATLGHGRHPAPRDTSAVTLSTLIVCDICRTTVLDKHGCVTAA
jgi:hypothetical protein